jgi:hypothetical protein
LGFLRLFQRQPSIRDIEQLMDFMDRNAAFLTQKGIYEYSRARAGHYAKVLFAEAGFRQAVEQSRWRAFPLGLAMVGELVEGVLRPHAIKPAEQGEALRALGLAIFDRYPVPASLGAAAWSEARADLARRLALVGLHPPKRAMDIAVPYARAYFDLMPIHEELRSSEFPTIRNYLRVTLCNIHDEFSRRADAQALAARLRNGTVEPAMRHA